MKRFNKYFISMGIAASALAMGSCVGDLDLLPSDPREITAADFAKDPEGYMNSVLADVYMQFATYGANGTASVHNFDGGMSTFQRAIFNLEEIPTDEANWLPQDDVDFATLQYGTVAPNNKVLVGTYGRLVINISLCNDFIQTVNNGYFKLNTPELQAMADDYMRQCRILRGGCYYYMLSLFGNVPYADENSTIGAVAPQLPRAEVFERVVADLEKVSESYASKPATTHWGFVGQDACDAILAKLYLNAELFTGTAQWNKCLEKANAVINRLKGPGFHGSGLAEHYHNLFAANNRDYAIGGANAVNENIWVIPSSESNLKNFAGSTLLIEGFIASQGVQETLFEPNRDDFEKEADYKKALEKFNKAKDWEKTVSYTFNGIDYSFNPESEGCCINTWYNVAQSGWKCMTAREEFVDKFEWLDPECSQSEDIRVKNWMTSFFGFSKANEALDQTHYGSNGYLPLKYTNYRLDANGEVMDTPKGQDCADADYVVIRLAEMYLTAAEAILHGAGEKNTALVYVNYVRQRAGLAPWVSADLTLDTLLDERARELYTENCRRTDLLRYGKYLSGYTWSWKGGVREGADLPASAALYPLPSTVVNLAGYEQNPGY